MSRSTTSGGGGDDLAHRRGSIGYRLGGVSLEGKEVAQHGAHLRVVVDDEDPSGLCGRRHGRFSRPGALAPRLGGGWSGPLGLPECGQDVRERDGLLQDAGRAERERLPAHFVIEAPAHDDDLGLGVERTNPLEGLEAAEPRHHEVEDDDRRPLALHVKERLKAVRRRDHLEPVHGELLGERVPDVCVVVDD